MVDYDLKTSNSVFMYMPNDWKIVTLSDVGDIITGSTPSTNIKEYYGNEYFFVSPGDISDNKYVLDTEKKLSIKGFNIARKIPENSVMMTCIGSTIGKSAMSDRELTTNQQINSIVCNEKYNSDFIYYSLKYFFNLFKNKYVEHQAVPIINKTQFSKFLIPVPNIKEQQQIATILSSWDKAIELKEKLIEQKKEQKKGLMQKLLTGEARLPGFEGVWKKVRLGKIGETYNGLSGKSAKDFGEGRPYIPYKTIFDNAKIDLTKLDYVRIESGENQNSAKYGDIFFTTSSETPDEVAMSSVLLDDVGEVYLNSFCFGYRLNNFSDLLPEFAQFIFRGDDFRKKTLRLAQGSTRFNISKNEVMKIEVSLPSIEEQESIATVLSNSDKEIKLLHKQVELLKQQKKGLMQLLLTGKVRVKV